MRASASASRAGSWAHASSSAFKLGAPVRTGAGLAFLSTRFAGKEAVAKALGLGMRSPMRWHAVEILNDASGRPLASVHADLRRFVERHRLRLHVSLTDERDDRCGVRHRGNHRMNSLGPVAVGVQGTSLTAIDRERLMHPLVGMVILFSANYESPEQLIRLCDDIHALRDPPLLIAVDHEGGRVQRFREGFTRLPPMRRLGELWDRDVLLACRVAASLGYVMAAELRAHGVDMTFAPVLDIDHGRSTVIGDRALHSDPRVVSMLAAHLTHGLLIAGMANCGKHFPGHGWAEADSHVALPVDGRDRSEILENDAAPYRWLGPMLAGVMPAHVVYTQIDQQPAGLFAALDQNGAARRAWFHRCRVQR